MSADVFLLCLLTVLIVELGVLVRSVCQSNAQIAKGIQVVVERVVRDTLSIWASEAKKQMAQPAHDVSPGGEVPLSDAQKALMVSQRLRVEEERHG